MIVGSLVHCDDMYFSVKSECYKLELEFFFPFLSPGAVGFILQIRTGFSLPGMADMFLVQLFP